MLSKLVNNFDLPTSVISSRCIIHQFLCSFNNAFEIPVDSSGSTYQNLPPFSVVWDSILFSWIIVVIQTFDFFFCELLQHTIIIQIQVLRSVGHCNTLPQQCELPWAHQIHHLLFALAPCRIVTQLQNP